MSIKLDPMARLSDHRPDHNHPSIVRTNNSTPYIAAVVSMAFLAVSAILGVTFIRPEADNTSLITTILGTLAPTTFALLAYMKAQETHLSVNSRLDAFVASAREIAYTRGIAEGQRAAIDAMAIQAAQDRVNQLQIPASTTSAGAAPAPGASTVIVKLGE